MSLNELQGFIASYSLQWVELSHPLKQMDPSFRNVLEFVSLIVDIFGDIPGHFPQLLEFFPVDKRMQG